MAQSRALSRLPSSTAIFPAAIVGPSTRAIV